MSKPLDQLQFRPGYSKPSESPLNLISRPKTNPDPTPNPLAAANSVKELWINSQKKQLTGATRAPLDDLATIEAGNSFHPQNPEGSMIKELLLKARMQAASENDQKNPLAIEVVPKESKTVEDSRIGQKRPLPPLPNKALVSPPKKPRTMDWNCGHGGVVVSSSTGVDSNSDQGGLLQISKVSNHHSSGGIVLSSAHSSALAGIPAPNISGSLLTGIKKNELSLFPFPENNLRFLVFQGQAIPPASTMSVPSNTVNEGLVEDNAEKFRKPESLPLAPGSFKTKKHIMLSTGKGATLISPDTPRPKKSYALQYQNGTAYTFVLGMRCHTNVYYTTISQAQPTYVQNKPKLSMYSNWKIVQKDSLTLPSCHQKSHLQLTIHLSMMASLESSTSSSKLNLNLYTQLSVEAGQGKQQSGYLPA